jgi:PAS domain S-box-containing protein
MNDQKAQSSPNAFEADKPGTNARTQAEAAIEALRLGGGVFVEAVRATRMPMVLTDPTLPGNPIVFANESFLKLSGYSMDEVLGQQPHFMNGPGTDPKDAARFAEMLRSEQDEILETVQYRKDGSRFVATVLLSAFKDEGGNVLNHFMSWLDVTRRVEAEEKVQEFQAAQAALRESEEQLRLIVESARDYAIFTMDLGNRITTWHAGAQNVFGWTPEEAIGQLVDITFTPEDREKGDPAKESEEARRTGSAPNVRWHLRKNGDRVFIEGHTIALRNENGTVDGFLKIGQDVTERHRASQMQATLLAELQHRVRNLLAMFRAVVRRTASTKSEIDDFVQHLQGRIDAMARTQTLLTRAPGKGVELEDVLRDELVAQSAAEDKFAVEGPAVSLSPHAAEILTLAIHELATNSVKYGALGGADGRVTISWELYGEAPEQRIELSWQETGIRPSANRRSGFGTELIEKRVPYELKGRGELVFALDGLTATIEFPLEDGSSILDTNPAPSIGAGND